MENRKGSVDENGLFITTATDGTSVRAEVEGAGPVILILHAGMDTGKGYAQVAARLARRYHVIRLHRRQYRLDLKHDPRRGSPCTVAEEVDHVLAIVQAVGTPVFLFGHSSGGPVALEALVVSPSSFAGAMIYEPASVINGAGGLHLAGERIERNGEVALGFDPVQALRTITALTNYVNGFVFVLQANSLRQAATNEPVTHDSIAELLSEGEAAPLLVAFAEGGSPYSEESFEYGLRALIEGCAAALKRRASKRT